VLPEGLEALFWNIRHCTENVEAGVLPDSLWVLRLLPSSSTQILPGALPAKLQWLALPAFYQWQGEEEVELPAHVRVHWLTEFTK
jgi:hypothetical protein